MAGPVVQALDSVVFEASSEGRFLLQGATKLAILTAGSVTHKVILVIRLPPGPSITRFLMPVRTEKPGLPEGCEGSSHPPSSLVAWLPLLFIDIGPGLSPEACVGGSLRLRLGW